MLLPSLAAKAAYASPEIMTCSPYGKHPVIIV